MSLISITGGDTPLAREVKDRAEEAIPGVQVQILGSSSSDALLTAVDDEAAVIAPADPERLRASDVILVTGDPAVARQTWVAGGGASGPPFVDLTYGLEGLPEARLRSPLSELDGFQPDDTGVYVVAQPAATALALLLPAIHAAYPIQEAVVQIFEPASERGQAGLSELQKQVSSLLSFRPLDKKIFDAQLAFNLLGRYGEDAPEKLQDIEQRLERHLATLLAGAVPMPSLKLIQAPVFHGHTLSLWIQLEERPAMEDLEAEIQGAGIDVRGADVEAPTNAGAAGQSGVTVGLIEPDRNDSHAVWIWAVADNYRMVADNAVAVVREILPGVRS